MRHVLDLTTPPPVKSRARGSKIPASAAFVDLTIDTPAPKAVSPRAFASKHQASPLSPGIPRKRTKAVMVIHSDPEDFPVKLEPMPSRLPPASIRGRHELQDALLPAHTIKSEPSDVLLGHGKGIKPEPLHLPVFQSVKREPAPPSLPGYAAVKSEPLPPAVQVKAESGAQPVVLLPPRVGDVFASLKVAVDTVYDQQQVQGYKFRRSQLKRDESGQRKKQVLRCSCYQKHNPTHLDTIDPADHRRGKSVRTDCTARVNINRVGASDLWTITTVDLKHNHARTIPPGATALRPPSTQERELVEHYANDHTFTRRHISGIVQRSLPDSNLDARQLTNIIHGAQSKARAAVIALGGDFHAVQAALVKYKEDDPRWTYYLLIDDDGKVTALFWQSPEQIRLAQAFGDVLLTDNAANRNQYQFSLNIGIAIDGSRNSRNIWYALHEREDMHSYAWVFDCYLQSTGNTSPECIFSDRHPAVIAAADLRLPMAFHFYCLDHLNGNIAKNLVPILGQRWHDFVPEFFYTYYSPSPEEFDRRWETLLSTFPSTRPYLQEHIYPIRQNYSWHWVSRVFTAGTRTTGRVESENRVNKALGGPTVSVKQLFNKLNMRTSDQTAKETMQFRQVRLFLPFLPALSPLTLELAAPSRD